MYPSLATEKSNSSSNESKIWTLNDITNLFDLPFNDLIFQAQTVHRQNFNPNEVQISTLLSIKTGSCPENCSYCPQSAHFDTGLKKEPLMDIDDVMEAAKRAKEAGASRFCMGAAWRGPRDADLDKVIAMIKSVKELGLESCATLGLLKPHQAQKLKEAGLNYYNHNIDTSEDFYSQIITTRKFEDRLETLQYVQEAGMHVCCGGIIGMGESQEDRAKMLLTLANMDTPPKSVPINWLIRVAGTPLENAEIPNAFDFIRTIAVARIVMPQSYVRLSAGREDMSDEMQALCFLAGANSIFYGEKLLVTKNPEMDKDNQLFNRLGIKGI